MKEFEIWNEENILDVIKDPQKLISFHLYPCFFLGCGLKVQIFVHIWHANIGNWQNLGVFWCLWHSKKLLQHIWEDSHYSRHSMIRVLKWNGKKFVIWRVCYIKHSYKGLSSQKGQTFGSIYREFVLSTTVYCTYILTKYCL